jgi:hypothetical protein
LVATNKPNLSLEIQNANKSSIGLWGHSSFNVVKTMKTMIDSHAGTKIVSSSQPARRISQVPGHADRYSVFGIGPACRG